MIARVEGLEDDYEMKSPREQGFFDKSFAVRCLIVFIFSTAIFLFLHFREIRVEVLELDGIAPNFVVSQIDFDFFDEQATLILKQEAVRDLDKIYAISSKEIRQRRLDFEKALVTSDDWRKKLHHTTFDELYNGGDAIEKGLFQLRFTDPRTLKKMQEVQLATPYYQIYAPKDIQEAVKIPSQIFEILTHLSLGDHSLSKEATQFIVGFFEDTAWHLVEDIPSERALKKKIQSNVPDKFTHVSAGDRIIDPGEKVTIRHIAEMQAMKRALTDQRNLWHPATLLGSLMLTILFVGISGAYFQNYHPNVLASNRKLFLVVTIFALTLLISKIVEFLLLSSNQNWMDTVRYPVFVPFAAILLCSLMCSSIAIFLSTFLTLLTTITLAFDTQGYMILNLAASIVAILSIHSLRRRKEIFIVCLKAWFASLVVIVALNLYREALLGPCIFWDVVSVGVCLLLTGVLVVGFLPLLESNFRIMTDVTLMEYMDPNNDILRKLTIEAPGTYQHSVVVGNLAETAALAIGANGLFCRVATLYHDIGKMTNPQYFTENRQGEVDIHKLLTPKESAQVIMDHVPEGVSIARRADFPEPFIDIIKEHHGTTLVYYFYRKELERMGGDPSKVDERDFRYSGPKPRSKESCIIMIADSLEAASRSLEQVNEVTLKELVDRLVREKAEDGQFDNALLTFEDLAVVKAALVKTLLASRHSRVKYPKRETKIASYPASEA